MKMIKTLVFLFLLLFVTHATAKENTYYKATLVHVLTECNTECKKRIFEDEVHKSFYILMDAILNQVRFELSLKQKESYD